ncbi:MAG: archaellin/type IV pilin N-terminal domain-containing protein [Thermoplasmatales archaeon]
MKKIFMPLEKKEKAVSPVIATILMVAITVVLAATVYILVSHYTSVGAATPLTASLAVDNEGQGKTTATTVYYYNLTITISTPTNLTNMANVHITVNGHPANLSASDLASAVGTLTSTGVQIDYLVFNTNGAQVTTYIQSGSTITIVSNTDLSGDTVSLTYTGYSGTVSTTLP